MGLAAGLLRAHSHFDQTKIERRQGGRRREEWGGWKSTACACVCAYTPHTRQKNFTLLLFEVLFEEAFMNTGTPEGFSVSLFRNHERLPLASPRADWKSLLLDACRKSPSALPRWLNER